MFNNETVFQVLNDSTYRGFTCIYNSWLLMNARTGDGQGRRRAVEGAGGSDQARFRIDGEDAGEDRIVIGYCIIFGMMGGEPLATLSKQKD